MTEEQAIQSVSFANKFLFAANASLGSLIAYTVYKTHTPFRELFMGMNLQLPVPTKLAMTPVYPFIGVLIVLLAVVGFFVLKKPEVSAKAQALSLGSLVAFWVVSMYAALVPMYQLLEVLS